MDALKLQVVSGNVMKAVILGIVKYITNNASSDRRPERQHVNV